MDDGHLRVVGELARSPMEVAASHHLAGATDHRFRESPRVLTRRSELERRAEGVTDGRADDGAERPLGEREIAHRAVAAQCGESDR